MTNNIYNSTKKNCWIHALGTSGTMMEWNWKGKLKKYFKPKSTVWKALTDIRVQRYYKTSMKS